MFQFRRFPSCAYLIQHRICGLFPQGFPHSDICGSILICSSPQLFAACRVFLRLPVPRHSPCALFCLTSLGSLKNYCGNLLGFVVFLLPFAKTEKPLNCPFKCLLYRCLFFSFVQFSMCSFLRVGLRPPRLSPRRTFSFPLVETNRIELSTPCLQGRCSPS